MEIKSYKNILEVTESDKTFSKVIGNDYLSSDLRDNLSEANLIILPIDRVSGHEGPVFESGTGDLFNFIKNNAGDEIIPEISIDDEDYVELIKHWDLVAIGTIIVQNLIAPLAVNLIYDYITSSVGLRLPNTHVKFHMIIEKDNASTKIHYEGPAEEFAEKLLPTIENLNKD